ncbi:MAG: DUF1512 family protein [Candidatus Aenigmarchaeota archaeon]|nr:DUF1512 family protein [Candidatus Aenigmarchaeota archaeon]
MAIFLQATDVLGQIVFFIIFFIFIFVYPRLMLSQLIYRIEQSAIKMEEMSRKANSLAAKKSGKAPSKELKNRIDEFTDLVVVEPSSIDPFGLVKKIDQTIRSMENRFEEFTDEIAGDISEKEKQELNYALRAAIGLRQISKVVRHFLEIAKKFKNLQIAMIIHMQLPMIEKVAESELKGTEAFASGWPIGDSIGPLVAASFMDKPKEIAEDVVVSEKVVEGRQCYFLKAKGPAPHLGRVDEAIEKIMKKKRIARVVTIDAAGKLEGEKTGSVAEGVGFAMGGIGQREIIENILLPKKMPIDTIVVKVGLEEAILPMKKDIYGALPKTRETVMRAIRRAKKGQAVLVIGVGNSCGVSDTSGAVDEVKKVVENLDRKYKEEKEKKKGGWF